MKTPKTPIEKWIEESYRFQVDRKIVWDKACMGLLTYLGLQDIENPKEWVEKRKSNDNIWIDKIQAQQDKNRALEAEITKLQEHINSLPTWADFNAVKSERDSAQCNLADLGDELDSVKAENSKLQKFKSYVHKRLDEMGVEQNPEGEHSKHGCRIGDRLDIMVELVMVIKETRKWMYKNKLADINLEVALKKFGIGSVFNPEGGNDGKS